MNNDERYRKDLQRQLELLWTDCRSFDQGQLSVALHIAVIVRVMFHSSKRSTSLLRLLGMNDIRLLSTSTLEQCKPSKNAVAAEGGLTVFRKGAWVAKRNTGNRAELISFKTWWDGEVVAIYKSPYTRRKIVLDAANKDGGAHVDPDLPESLTLLKEGPWIYSRISANAASNSSNDLHFQYLRQIAYEVLHSDEIFRIVSNTFKLKTDKDIDKEHELSKDKAIEKAKLLYENALTLIQNGEMDTALVLIEQSEYELIKYQSKDTVEPLMRVLLLKLDTYPDLNPDQYIKPFEGILKNPRGKLKGGLVGIYLKITYHMSVKYNMLGKISNSIKCSEEIIRISLEYLSTMTSEIIKQYPGPIQYILMSSNDLALHHLNDNKPDLALSTIEKLFMSLEKFTNWLLLNPGTQIILDIFGKDCGPEVLRQISKAYIYHISALLVLNSIDEAKVIFEKIHKEFAECSDAYIAGQISKLSHSIKKN